MVSLTIGPISCTVIDKLNCNTANYLPFICVFNTQYTPIMNAKVKEITSRSFYFWSQFGVHKQKIAWCTN